MTDDSVLEIAPPRRAFLYIFLITGVVLLLNGLAVLVFAPIPRSPGAVQPSFGVGGWMPIVAGLLCFAGAGWMLNRHRRVALIAQLIQADLPQDGVDPDSRDTLVTALFDRAKRLDEALHTFPEALVTIVLKIGGDRTLELDHTRSGVSARLSPVDDRLARAVGRYWECVNLETEILIDLASPERAQDFLETLTGEILGLPPDFELAGDIRISKRDVRGEL